MNKKSSAVKLIAFVCLILAAGSCFAAAKRYVMYVGAYTNNGSKGIYAYNYDPATGKLTPIGLAAATENPSFLVADSSGAHLYAVNESENYQGASSGGVSAFAIDRASGKLTELNEVASHGADPCFISLDRSGKFLLVANYTGGDVAVFPVLAGGRIGEASSVIQDEGELGPNKARQEKPHAHWIETSARDHFAYVSDLGLDRVLVYKFDATKGTLSRGDSAGASKDFFSATLAPGTGPRHVAFSAGGQFMYVIGELDSTVTVFANDEKETYRSIQKISALPAGFAGKNTTAEITIHPNGKFLYTSNRGDDSMAVFSINRATGKLTFVQRIPSGGKTPRHFAIDPAGTHLLVANQDTGNVIEFTIDQVTGKLKSKGEVAKVPAAVCVVFAEE